MRMTWTYVPGWDVPWADLFVAVVNDLNAGAVCCEHGTLMGRTAACLATAIQASGKAVKVDSIDNRYSRFAWLNATADGTRALLDACGFSDIVTVKEMHPVEAAVLYENQSLDFVFMDFTHDYDDLKAIITTYLPKMKPGGQFLGDDYDDVQYPGVVKAVNELLPQRTLIPAGSHTMWQWTIP